MAVSENPTPLKSPHAADVAQEPALCMRCAMCCNGTIHNAAVLDDDEVGAAQEIGLDVLARPGRPGFSLPCSKLSGTICSIFGGRPRVCSRFQCQLLLDMRLGEVSRSEAEAMVAHARALLASIQRAMPDGMTLREAWLFINPAYKPAYEMAERNVAELRLGVTSLELYLDKHFRKPKEGKMLAMVQLDEPGADS